MNLPEISIVEMPAEFEETKENEGKENENETEKKEKKEKEGVEIGLPTKEEASRWLRF